MCPYIHFLGRTLGTYGICMLLGFALAIFLANHRGKRFGLKFEDLIICAAFGFGFAMIFGGLLYIIVTYSWAQIVEFIRQGNFSFLSGGIVFYGGLIGGFFGCLLGLKVAKVKFYTVEQAVVPFIPLGHAIGRVGCVMAGCCHGFEYDGPFALYYPNSVSGLSPEQGYFPVQLLEGFINCIIIVPALLIIGKRAKRPTVLLSSYLALYAISRFFMEMLRGDKVRGKLLALSTSQWISVALLVLAAIDLTVVWLRSRRKQPA